MMDATYETWVGVAFLMWLAGVVWFFISINSQLERNLRKVSLRLSWISLNPKEVDPDAPEPSAFAKICKFAFIQGLGFISIFLGPLYVAFAVGMFAYSRWKDSGAPASVKEIRWRMRNVDMTRAQVEELLGIEPHEAGLQYE